MTAEEVKKRADLLREKIPQNTYMTIVGQINAGDIDGAAAGIKRLERRIARRETKYEK